jgi:hypothetical protein
MNCYPAHVIKELVRGPGFTNVSILKKMTPILVPFKKMTPILARRLPVAPIMLQKLSEQVRVCNECAAEAARRAEEISDPEVKAEMLEMERRWLALARNYELTEILGDFTAAIWDRLRQSQWQHH